MIRKIVSIDETKCTGCGLCIDACHEKAIRMENGKARLVGDDYCDGLGACLPACPAGAISIIEREAADYDGSLAGSGSHGPAAAHDGSCACPGAAARRLSGQPAAEAAPRSPGTASELRTWPIQIRLAPVNAPFFDGARLLVASDCTAYAHGDFHRRFLRGRVALIGCPKLDPVDYSEKLAEILRQNDIKSVHVVRMEVPCCNAMRGAVERALRQSGKMIPWQATTLSLDGQIIDE